MVITLKILRSIINSISSKLVFESDLGLKVPLSSLPPPATIERCFQYFSTCKNIWNWHNLKRFERQFKKEKAISHIKVELTYLMISDSISDKDESRGIMLLFNNANNNNSYKREMINSEKLSNTTSEYSLSLKTLVFHRFAKTENESLVTSVSRSEESSSSWGCDSSWKCLVILLIKTRHQYTSVHPDPSQSHQ